MASDTTRYTNKVFMTGALPLLKVSELFIVWFTSC